MITHQQETLSNNLAINEQVVNKANVLIDNIKVVETLLDAVLTVNKVNVERNIDASEKLVNKAQKDAYKLALETIEKAKTAFEELKNITSVYERTEIKEVIVEKDDNSLSGRV